MPAHLENSPVTTGLKKVSFHSNPKKGNAKECTNYRTATLISHASKIMFKILQARLWQYMNHELPDAQEGFRKGRGTRDQIANICWIIKKAREFKKNIYFCFDCVDHNRLWKILKEIGIPHYFTCLLIILYAKKSSTWNQTWNNGLVQNWERSAPRLYIVTLFI